MCFFKYLSLLNINIKYNSLLIYLEAMSLKAHSHRAKANAKAKNLFDCLNFFFDLFQLFFDFFALSHWLSLLLGVNEPLQFLTDINEYFDKAVTWGVFKVKYFLRTI